MRGLVILLVTLSCAGCPAPENGPPGPSSGGDGAPPATASQTAAPSPAQTQKAPGEGKQPEEAPREAAASSPRETSVAGVKVGQRYHFRVVQPQMTIEQVWTITEVGPEQVRYDLRSVTRMAPMEGVPDSPPVEDGPTPKVFLLTREDVPAGPNPPQRKGSETVMVGGAAFPCEIYENEATKLWISHRFPREIRIEQEGRPFKSLVKIEAPE